MWVWVRQCVSVYLFFSDSFVVRFACLGESMPPIIQCFFFSLGKEHKEAMRLHWSVVGDSELCVCVFSLICAVAIAPPEAPQTHLLSSPFSFPPLSWWVMTPAPVRGQTFSVERHTDRQMQLWGQAPKRRSRAVNACFESQAKGRKIAPSSASLFVVLCGVVSFSLCRPTAVCTGNVLAVCSLQQKRGQI